MREDSVRLESLLEVMSERRVFDLSQPLKQGMPTYPTQVPFCFSLNRRHGDPVFSNGVSTANDIMFLGGHAGTHIDAVGHFSRDGRLFGGLEAATHQTGQGGLAALGIEKTAPILRRGVMLDVASFKGVDVLEQGYAIGPDELAQVALAQGSEIRPGDVVVIRTGWTRHWGNPSVFSGAANGLPGPNLDAARWLAEAGMSLTGADQPGYEKWPGEGEVHEFLLVQRGIQIIENLNLDELARERVYSFLFIALPLRIVGGTASPIRPVAVV